MFWPLRRPTKTAIARIWGWPDGEVASAVTDRLPASRRHLRVQNVGLGLCGLVRLARLKTHQIDGDRDAERLVVAELAGAGNCYDLRLLVRCDLRVAIQGHCGVLDVGLGIGFLEIDRDRSRAMVVFHPFPPEAAGAEVPSAPRVSEPI